MTPAQPPSRGRFTTIPVIDLAPLFTPDPEARREIGAQIREACTTAGFFYVKNHGIAPAILHATLQTAAAYFAQPLAVKMRNHVSLSKNIRGYAALLEENTDPTAKGDFHESFDIALEVPESEDPAQILYGPNQWPAENPEFRAALTHCYEALLTLGNHLLAGFALALDLPETYFAHLVTKPMATMRILHYPPQPATHDPAQIGIGAHSDYECFTMLIQQEGVSALQVRNLDGDWIEADPIPGCLVVNIGDQMARWTNDLFVSTQHRVINISGRERYSIPFFFGPNYDTLIEALPSCVTPERPAKYQPITAGAYIKGRFEETFVHFAAANEPSNQ